MSKSVGICKFFFPLFLAYFKIKPKSKGAATIIKFKSFYHQLLYIILGLLSFPILIVYFPFVFQKITLFKIFSLAILTLGAAWATRQAYRRFKVAFSITGGVTFAATLLYGVEGGIVSALVEVIFQSYRHRTPLIKSLYNLSLIVLPVFFTYHVHNFLQELMFPRLISDLLVAVIYWMIGALLLTAGYFTLFNTSFLEIIKGPIRQSIDTFLLALMVGEYASRLVAVYGPGYLIPIILSLIALIRLLKPKNKYEIVHQKILNNLPKVKTLRGLQDTVLRDIVNEIGVTAAAIVMGSGINATIVSYGDFPRDSYKADDKNHPSFICFRINDESHLVIVNKITISIMKDEIDFVENVSRYLGISIENIELISQLTDRIEDLLMDTDTDDPKTSWLRNSFIQILEQERQRIASDLHDTTMQDLLFAIRDLRSLKHGKGKSIEEIVEHLEIVNTSLRETCFNLFPPNLSEMGLIAAIRHLIHLEQPRVNFMINFKSETNSVETMPLEAKRDFFRIIQELISNAKKHLTGDFLELTFGETQDYNNLFLLYKDNGTGLKSLTNIDHKGFGLLQIKNRILNLNGSVEITSKKGLEVYITVPLSILDMK